MWERSWPGKSSSRSTARCSRGYALLLGLDRQIQAKSGDLAIPSERFGIHTRREVVGREVGEVAVEGRTVVGVRRRGKMAETFGERESSVEIQAQETGQGIGSRSGT